MLMPDRILYANIVWDCFGMGQRNGETYYKLYHEDYQSETIDESEAQELYFDTED